MSIRINNKIISGTYTAQSYRYVGEIFQSALPIEDSRVALLDGHKIYESEGYGSFIQYITSLALLYPQLSCTEDEWQEADTTYGECGKFVIGEDGVRLPKIVSFVQGLSSLQDLATLVEAGLPNITGSTSHFYLYNKSITGSGAFSFATGGGGINNTTTADNTGSGVGTFNASKSNPIYGNSTTVQPQSIRYPYYIVLATGVTQEVKVKEELTTNIPFTLFESKYSEVELNNTSWLLSSGQWNSKELYPSAYNELVKEYNAGSNKYSIKLYTDEYNDYDFVLNLDDETFRLPLLDGSESLVDYSNAQDLGVSATFTVLYNGYIRNTVMNASGVHDCTVNGIPVIEHCSSAGVYNDASTIFVKRGDVFKSNFIQDRNIFYKAIGNGSLYFYIGDTNINVSLVDTGKLTQEVANLIPNNSSLIGGYSMPSNKYVDLALGANGSTYIAPANGWFYCQATNVGDRQFMRMLNVTYGTEISEATATNTMAGIGCGCILPIKKGEVMRFDYVINSCWLRFVYAEGEK